MRKLRLLWLVSLAILTYPAHSHTFADYAKMYAPYLLDQEVALQYYVKLVSTLSPATQQRVAQRRLGFHLYAPPTMSYCSTPDDLAGLRLPPNPAFPPVLVVCKRAVVRAAYAASSLSLFFAMSDLSDYRAVADGAIRLMSRQVDLASRDYVLISTRNIDSAYPCSPLYCAAQELLSRGNTLPEVVSENDIKKFVLPAISKNLIKVGARQVRLSSVAEVVDFEQKIVSETTNALLNIFLLHELSHLIEGDVERDAFSEADEIRADEFAIRNLMLNRPEHELFLRQSLATLLYFVNEIRTHWSGARPSSSERIERHMRAVSCSAASVAVNPAIDPAIRSLLGKVLLASNSARNEAACR